MDTFSSRIRRLRQEQEMTQDAVAQILGISKYCVSTYENGREPAYSILVAYAKLFDVSTDYLLGLTDNRTTLSTDHESDILYALNAACDRMNSEFSEHDIKLIASRILAYAAHPSPAVQEAPLVALTSTLKNFSALLKTLSEQNIIDSYMAINKLTGDLLGDMEPIMLAILKQDKDE